MTYNEQAERAVRHYREATGQYPTHMRMGVAELQGLKAEVSGSGGVWVVKDGIPRIFGCEVVLQDSLQGFWAERR